MLNRRGGMIFSICKKFLKWTSTFWQPGGNIILIFILTSAYQFRYDTSSFLLEIVTVCVTIFYISFVYLVFPFDFILNKIIHPSRVTIIECNRLVMHQSGKNAYYSLIKESDLSIDRFVLGTCRKHQYIPYNFARRLYK